MSLHEKLEAIKAKSAGMIPPETRAVMAGANDSLRRSGILERTLKVGDQAPAFALPNTQGQVTRSQDLLAHGPLVVTFYRGGW